MSNAYRIDAAMTGETPQVTARAVDILIWQGWNVEFERGTWNGAPDQSDHAYSETSAFQDAFWAAVQQATDELSAPLTVTECAALYNLNRCSVTKACREGRVEATRPGREYRIDRASAAEYWGRRLAR